MKNFKSTFKQQSDLGNVTTLNSKAVTRIQAVILVAIIVIAAVGGGAAYILLGDQEESSETIKIGVIGDLDMPPGRKGLQGAILAAEQINAEGGILGRFLEIVAEDEDSLTPGGDPTRSVTALTRLITLDKVDFILSMVAGEAAFACQDVIAEHKKIYISVLAAIEDLTQRVVDDYNRYKYFFRYSPPNSTAVVSMIVDSVLHLRDITGFNKIAYLADYYPVWDECKARLELLPEVHGFELVYGGEFTPGTIDFTSYYAAAEGAGTEALISLIATESIPFVKEWCDRQSPMVVWGFNVQASDSAYWDWTDGKCEHMTAYLSPIDAKYGLTSKTMPFYEAYWNRWGETPTNAGTSTYDVLRFVLVDALEQAGTTETDAVIEALERTDVETSMAQRFVFTSSHDVMVGPGYDEPLFFQWQTNGTMVPVYPKEIMEEAGATYTYPDWPGPWD